jgi:hypothetical protein
MNVTGRDSDRIALQEFSKVIDDFHFDAPEGQTQLSVSYGDRGKRWIKRMKKLDPFWDANLFISNLFLQSMQKALEENKEKIEEKIVEVKDEQRSSD